MQLREFASPGGGNPATGRLVFNYLETGIPSKQLSKWALEAPKAGQFQEEGRRVPALPLGWTEILARALPYRLCFQAQRDTRWEVRGIIPFLGCGTYLGDLQVSAWF